jgi:hypothetical protein
VRFKHIFCIIVILLAAKTVTKAQTKEVDSLEKIFGRVLCDTLPELADSVFQALKTKKFERLAYYAPTAEIIKAEMDTQDAAALQRMSLVKYEYIHKRLRKDHVVLTKYAKYYKLSLRRMELLDYKVESKVKNGHHYGKVILYVREGKDEFYITFAAIEIQDRWFIGDYLRLVPAQPNLDVNEKIPRRNR